MADSVDTFSHDREPSLEAGDAVSAALGITELLLLIVSAVPLHKQTSIRRVSKSCQAAIEKVGHTIDPVGYGFFRYYYHKYLRNPNLPLYSPDLQLSHNQALRYLSGNTTSVVRLHHWGCILDFAYDQGSTRPAHGGRDNEFITNPPITQMVLCAGQDDDALVANLRVPGGIKIGDLKHCLSKLVAEEVLGEKCAYFSQLMESCATAKYTMQRRIGEREDGSQDS